MPRFPIAVTFLDGHTEVLEAGRPAVLIAFADTFRKQFPDAEGPDMMRELAWLGWRATAHDVPFEEWIETVAEVTAQEEEAAPAEDPPTPAPEQPVEPPPPGESPPPPAEPGEPQEPAQEPQESRLMLATHGGG